jgi:hypothetical protein
MIGRYNNREVVNNNSDRYKEIRDERNILVLRQYTTPALKHPTSIDIQNITIRNEVWKTGSKLFKIAKKYYGSPKLWWIIAWYNQKPTEAHFQVGDIVEVPTPLEEIIRILEV